MKISPIIFGSTGMIGQGVLLECIEDNNVEKILLVSRGTSKINHPKIKEILHRDFTDFSSLTNEFSDYDSCFFCLGISAVGLTESEYYATTYELTVRVAESILKTGKDFTFCYVSGAGTDRSEKGRIMWARVKGKLENKLLSMPFKNAYMFRPGYIQPMRGIKSKTIWYNLFYMIFKPLYFILRSFKGIVTDTSSLGKAMIHATEYGYPTKIIESKDIYELAKG